LKTVEPILRDDAIVAPLWWVNLKTAIIEGYVRAAEQRIWQEAKLPENYLVEFGGQFENMQVLPVPYVSLEKRREKINHAL
jgi:Cu/Ag efflux pump CusA